MYFSKCKHAHAHVHTLLYTLHSVGGKCLPENSEHAHCVCIEIGDAGNNLTPERRRLLLTMPNYIMPAGTFTNHNQSPFYMSIFSSAKPCVQC